MQLCVSRKLHEVAQNHQKCDRASEVAKTSKRSFHFEKKNKLNPRASSYGNTNPLSLVAVSLRASVRLIDILAPTGFDNVASARVSAVAPIV